MYAGDRLLISSSVLNLQCMVDICNIEGNYLGIKFNYNKSNCISIGPRRFANLSTLYLLRMPLAWVEKIKYLGVHIIGGKSCKVDTSTMRLTSLPPLMAFLVNVLKHQILAIFCTVKLIVCLY